MESPSVEPRGFVALLCVAWINLAIHCPRNALSYGELAAIGQRAFQYIPSLALGEAVKGLS